MSSWTRRDFLRAAVAASGATAFGATTLRALEPSDTAQQGGELRVGLIVGETSASARAAALGAELGGGEAARLAEMLRQRFELVSTRADGCEAAAREAVRLIENAGVFAIAGAVDLDSCLALSDLAVERGFVFLNILSPEDELRGERCSRHTFHVGASTAMNADACAEWLVGEAGLGGWHFVTSGSDAGEAAYRRAKSALLQRGGTELGNTVVRSESELARPLLNKLEQDSPDLVFICLDEAERAAFLKLYNRSRPSFEVAGPFAGLARQWTANPEARAGIWPVLWHHKLFKYGAEQLSDRFRARFQRPMNGPGWAGWMAVKILAEAALRARTTQAGELARFLETDAAQFDGHKGYKLTFRTWDHQLRQPLYLVRLRAEARDGGDVFDAVAELPRGDPATGQTPAEFLDRLGDERGQGRCGFAGS